MVEKILNNTTPYRKIRASHEGSLHSSTLKLYQAPYNISTYFSVHNKWSYENNFTTHNKTTEFKLLF